MADIAQLGFAVDSSGLEKANTALDQTVESAGRVGKATDKVEADYRQMVKAIDDGARSIRDGMGGASSAIVGELQQLNRTNTASAATLGEIRGMLAGYQSTVAATTERLHAQATAQAAATQATSQAATATAAASAKVNAEAEKSAASAARARAASEQLSRERERAARAADTEARAMAASTARRDRLTALLSTERGQRIAEAEAMRRHNVLLGQTAAGYTATGMSAKQMQMATRMLPMQFSDIAISLQAGISPLQVFLQQGSQIKDSFGGALPALRAMGGYVMGLVNPFTLAAAAVVAFAVAWTQLENRQNAIDRSLMIAGRYTSGLAEDLRDLSREMDDMQGVTAGSASKAIAEVAKVGTFTASQLEQVSRAAEQWRVATGTAVEDTITVFERLQRKPVETLLDLHDKHNLLTPAILESVMAFKEQGKEAEAAQVAFDAYSAMIEDRSPHIVQQMGLISSTMSGIGRAASEMWDGFVEGLAWADRVAMDFAARHKGTVAGLMATIPGLQLLGAGTLLPGVVGGEKASKGMGASKLFDARAAAEADKARVDAEKEYGRLVESNLSKAEKLEAEILEIRQLGLKAGRSEADIEKQIAQARARYAESLPKARAARTATDPAAGVIQQLERQIALNNEQAASEEKLTATERLLVQVRTDMERIGGKTSAASRDRVTALLAEAEASGKAAHAEEVRRRDMAANAALTEQLAQAERLRAQQAQTDLLGIGRGGDATDMLRRQLEIQRQYLSEVEKLDRQQRNKNSALSADEYERELQMLVASRDRMLEIERGYQQQRLALQGDWRNGFTRALDDYAAAAVDAASMSAGAFSNAFASFEDAIANAATKGKLSFSDMANSIIADLARIGARMATNALLQSIFGGFGSGATSYNGMGEGTAFDVSSYAALPYGGARARGGGTRRDRYYQVGEGDRPELLQEGGRQYLIPGDRGRVNPIAHTRTTATAPAPPVVNVSIERGANEDRVESSTNSSGGVDIRVMLKREVSGMLASGELDMAARQRWGVQARGNPYG